MTDPVGLGDRIETLRKAAGLSQAQFAEQLGISRSAFQYYERGERDLPAQLLLKICELFDDDAHRLLTGGPSPLLLSRIDYFAHLLDARLEDLDISITPEARQRVLMKVLKDDLRAHPNRTENDDAEEMDSLIRMVR
ncbi:helix-turn-helix domain-containing protein [Paracoccus sp. (in: a-proteobacteria)]|uniref:helix-turn-helix domain-containing protein n=1 Tax=Paracoccus sp. TaxID=267 RepID=UPI0026DF0F60|nr:helix-turn-helix transcriptional regulator [Paracoccus sp. (in: a-proteobacteria)]MDO5646328.1 helix-turn-helix transcriptional regulator [Paracoccus sp. (in: a-proteobacteria)]